MAFTFPSFRSLFSQPVTANNFTALQSAVLSVSNAGASGSLSKSFPDFAVLNGRITAKITNTGSKGCYLASGGASATAVVATGTPQPVTGSVSNCDYIAAGAILTQDYIPGTYTFAAICAGTDTTDLQISLGNGQ